MRPRLPRGPRLLASLLAALVLAALAAVAAPGTAAAASCTYPTFSVYPGSGIAPYYRYGRVDFHFEACGSDSPSAWRANVAGAQVNSTGKNLGFFIDSTSIPATASGSYYKDFQGRIQASTCVPRVGWPCSRSYSFSVNYRVTRDRYGNMQVYQGTRSAPSGMALWTTP